MFIKPENMLLGPEIEMNSGSGISGSPLIPLEGIEEVSNIFIFLLHLKSYFLL